ncbi:glutactin [Stomoxys calcitrans]|uniref:glutactin n=1 Tax=Stomoxys calcitrans TaxID=35570 RepID=UPI0027E37AD7|nr:glutactin [Stomoxys calcitrans]
MASNLVSFASLSGSNMSRKNGKLKSLLQCLVLGGFLLQLSMAQHQHREPYNINEDFGDYEEDVRFDNHHPLDPHANYAHHPQTNGHMYRGDSYSQTDRDDYPEPRIIAPPVPETEEENPYSREQTPESTSYEQSHVARSQSSREEYPEPRIIAPHISTSNTREETVVNPLSFPSHLSREYPAPRIIAPHQPNMHESDMRHRQESEEPRAKTPHSPRAEDRSLYDREENMDPRTISHQPPSVPTHTREDPRLISPPAARADDRSVYGKEENPNPHTMTHHVPTYAREDPRPAQRADDRSLYGREENPYPHTMTQQAPTYARTDPRQMSPQAPRAEDRSLYEREEHRHTPSVNHQAPTYTREDPRMVTPHTRVEVPEARQMLPIYTATRTLYPQADRREERPVDPRTITPPPPRNYPESQHMPPPPQHRNALSTGNRETHVISVPRLGSVRGYREFKIIRNRPISAYLGLKYATVRPGIGRFQSASPAGINPYGEIDATFEPSNCPQFPDLSLVAEREARGEDVDDCLSLNIYTPARPGSYPVMVFVHGEMLFDGSAEEGQPDYFLEHDVVLVTVNYRLAPFGYLSTLTDDMPGNVALSDVQMSLEWLQQNIRYFNGNPDQVTLFGQAGGATLVHALSLSGKAQGLFHKLILQSGTALNPYFLDEQPTGTLRSFAHFARCPPSRSIEGFASCFERMKTSELLNYFKRYFESNEPKGLAFVCGFKLIVGDKLGYLPQHPASMVANNTYPTIVGVAKDAGAFIMTRFYDQLVELRSRNISDYINVVLKHTSQQRHYQLWKNWALTHIFTPEDVRNPTIQGLVQKLLELVNLILYRAPVVDSFRYTSKNFSTYLYCFDYRGQHHRFGHLRNPLPFEIDATLSDDNIYLFPYPEEVSRLNPMDKNVANSMVRMWVSFAQYGMPAYNQSIWPNVSTEFGPFLRFTNTRAGNLELDYHFGDGIPVPNLYPEYFTTTTTTTTTTSTTSTSTTTTTTPRPYPSYNYQQRSQHPNYQQYPHHYYPNRYGNPEQTPSQPGQTNTNPRYSQYSMRHQRRLL